MHFSKIHIENMLSFENVDFEFQNYNVIVGINNAGKTNLMRILQEVSSSNLIGYSLDKKTKFSTEEKSHLEFELKLTDEELKLLLQSIFERTFTSSGYSRKLKNIKVRINFSDVINDISYPTTIMIEFISDLWIIADQKQIIIVNMKLNEKDNLRKVYQQIKYLNFNQITQHLKNSGIGIATGFPTKPEFFVDLVNGNDTKDHFIVNRQNRLYRHSTTLKFDINDPQQHISEIYDYIGRKKESPSSIHFSDLLSKIIKKNFIPIEEIHPSYEQLTNSLFKLKVENEKAYQILQESFASVFNGTTVRVEQDRNNENVRKIIVSEKEKDFEIRESASGHYAAIHILHTILNKPNTVLLLDEPEVHFHPVKIRQLGQKFMELSEGYENQIITITHSPKFVDFRLLDPAYSFSLLNMTKENNASKVSTISSQADIALSPHLFNPEMYFGSCSLLVEGADDEFTIRSISDKFDGILDRAGITIINCWGVNHIFPTILLHQEYNIEFVALADKEYTEELENVVVLEDKLETELAKTGWKGTKKDLKPEIAYYYIQELLETKEGFEKLEQTDIWKVFLNALETAKIKIPNFEEYY